MEISQVCGLWFFRPVQFEKAAVPEHTGAFIAWQGIAGMADDERDGFFLVARAF